MNFRDVVFPPGGAQKLPPLPAEPTYDAELGEEKYKVNERMIEARGVDEVNNMLIHKQYGLAAVSGGMLRHQDLQMIMTHINKCLTKDQFAIWRVDAPWLPRTRKAQGTRLGGGKGSIHHYVTPVRAGRIICEVGGYITNVEAIAYMAHLPDFIPFPIEFISEQIMQERIRTEAEIQKMNTNPFNWERVIKYNMQNCASFLSDYDIMWKGKYK